MSGLWTVITSHDPNMGLYYVLLHFWTRVFGYSEAAVRSMTVVLAGFAVPVMYLLGRRLFGRRAGIIAALLLAMAPFFVQYEQTARSYALVVLLVLLSSYFFVGELEKPSRATLVAYVVASVLAVYAHYFAAFVLLVQALTLIAVRRRGAVTVAWLSAAGAIVALCIPAAVFAHRAGTSNISWIHTPGLGTLFHLPTDLAGSRLLALALGVLACYGFARALADRQGWQAGFVAAWLIVPVILVFAVSRLGRPLFVAYYLIVVLPAFVLLASAGVAKLPRREASWAAAAALWCCRRSASATGTTGRRSRTTGPRRVMCSPTSGPVTASSTTPQARCRARPPDLRTTRRAPASADPPRSHSASPLGPSRVRLGSGWSRGSPTPPRRCNGSCSRRSGATTGRRVRPPISATSP